MNPKIIRCIIPLFLCFLCLNGCYSPPSYLPLDFGQGSYSAEYLLGSSGMVLSTVRDDPNRMEGYYRLQGEDHPIYMTMKRGISQEEGTARIYRAEDNVEILYVFFLCDEDTLTLYNVWDVDQNGEYHVDLFEIYEEETIVLKKQK